MFTPKRLFLSSLVALALLVLSLGTVSAETVIFRGPYDSTCREFTLNENVVATREGEAGPGCEFTVDVHAVGEWTTTGGYFNTPPYAWVKDAFFTGLSFTCSVPLDTFDPSSLPNYVQLRDTDELLGGGAVPPGKRYHFYVVPQDGLLGQSFNLGLGFSTTCQMKEGNNVLTPVGEDRIPSCSGNCRCRQTIEINPRTAELTLPIALTRDCRSTPSPTPSPTPTPSPPPPVNCCYLFCRSDTDCPIFDENYEFTGEYWTCLDANNDGLKECVNEDCPEERDCECDEGEPDLSIEKTMEGGLGADNKLTFGITITNHGPGQAEGFGVTDTLPESTRFVRNSPETVVCLPSGSEVRCTSEEVIDEGEQFTFTITVQVVPGIPPDSTLKNTACVDDPSTGEDECDTIEVLYTCWETGCTSSTQCFPDLKCIGGRCVNPICPADQNCNCNPVCWDGTLGCTIVNPHVITLPVANPQSVLTAMAVDPDYKPGLFGPMSFVNWTLNVSQGDLQGSVCGMPNYSFPFEQGFGSMSPGPATARSAIYQAPSDVSDYDLPVWTGISYNVTDNVPGNPVITCSGDVVIDWEGGEVCEDPNCTTEAGSCGDSTTTMTCGPCEIGRWEVCSDGAIECSRRLLECRRDDVACDCIPGSGEGGSWFQTIGGNVHANHRGSVAHSIEVEIPDLVENGNFSLSSVESDDLIGGQLSGGDGMMGMGAAGAGNLRIEKSFHSLQHGEQLRFLIQLTNNGTEHVQGFEITETLPVDTTFDQSTMVNCQQTGTGTNSRERLTCTSNAAIAPGQSKSFEIRARFTSEVDATTELVNTACVNQNCVSLNLESNGYCPGSDCQCGVKGGGSVHGATTGSDATLDPGIVSGSNSPLSFGSGHANAAGWRIDSYPSLINPWGGVGASRPYNFDYFYELYDYPEENMFAETLGGYVPGGVYVRGGNLRIDPFVGVAQDRQAVIFVKGNLTIGNPVSVEQGGFLAFVVQGNISISPDLSGNLADPAVQGIFVADQKIITESAGEDSDEQLFLGGTFVSYGGFELRRDLLVNDKPAEVFIYRPDLVFNSPNALRTVDYVWNPNPD